MIDAMFLILLTALVLAVAVSLSIATWHAVRMDRPHRAPRSHRVDPDFLPPSARLLGH